MMGMGLVELAGTTASTLLLVGMIFALVRIVRGPSLPDRVVALDMLSLLLVSFAAVAAVTFEEVVFLEVAMTLALLAFIATVALARSAERSPGSGVEGGGS